MNRVSHSRGMQTDTVQSVWAGGKAACTPSCRFRHTLALHVKESCLKETDFLWLTACSMGLPQPCPTFTPADWEAYPGLENRLSLIPAACQDSSKPQLPFLGKKWKKQEIKYQKEHSLQQEAIKRPGTLKRTLLQATLEVQKLRDWNSGRG